MLPSGIACFLNVQDCHNFCDGAHCAQQLRKTELNSRFFTAWLKLRYHPKWNTQQINERMHPPPPPPPPPPLDPTLSEDTAVQAARPTAPPPPEDQDDRPIGGKAAKRRRLQVFKISTVDTDRVEAMAASTAVAARRVAASEEANTIASTLAKNECKAGIESNRVANETMLTARASKYLEIARATLEECPDEISKKILMGMEALERQIGQKLKNGCFMGFIRHVGHISYTGLSEK
ncbi:no apical meristem-associated C-terminal domain protein [Puccinia sorghi]|uniref:No apical meristem-associated C-terminal domain protein n=1 Tax=Puccinia sorghi TaxID=27349 RepID=A0A0L6V8S0_9BASI|nr:no apical meristem-associated C-terminal domain protein [Puccinia sorghi]